MDSRVVPDAVEFGMTYITGHDRSQLLLLPEAVDDLRDAYRDRFDRSPTSEGRRQGVELARLDRQLDAPRDLLAHFR